MQPDRREGERAVVMLGAESGVLDRAARELLDRAPESADGRAMDLSHWLLVVPGARAGRLALRALVEEAGRRGRAVDPPEVTTTGSLVERLLAAPTGPVPAPATSLERRLAWMQALEAAPAAQTAPLVGRGREAGRAGAPDVSEWWRIATHAVRLEDELRGAGRTFDDVAAATERRGADPGRARAFAAVEPAMAARLASIGLATPHHDRETRIQAGAPRCSAVALFGVLELGAPQRAALARARRVVAFVVAGDDRRRHFDDLGCAAPSWSEVQLAVEDSQVVSAESAADQAEAALEFIADAIDADGGHAADEIVIGLGDESLGPALALRARDAGVEVHEASGTPLIATSVGRLLVLLEEWRRTRRPASLAAIIRHPAVERTLRSRGGIGRDPIAALDAVRSRRLPSAIARSSDAAAEAQFGTPDSATSTVVAAVRALDAILTDADDPRRLGDAFATIEWDADDRPALDVMIGLLDDVAAVDVSLRASRDALALALDEAARAHVPGEPRERAVEALGWLELLIEPARIVAVLGMNDGCVPAGPAPDPILTESLRGELGLPTRASRAARDAAILDVLLRRSRALRLVAGRTASDGVPLEPSRFLLTGEGPALARRVTRLFDPRGAIANRRAWRRRPGPVSAFRMPEAPTSAAAIASMRVTAFRDYLESPLRFWLRHVEGIDESLDDVRELAPPDGGTLVHDVVATAAKDGLFGAATDAEALADELGRRLDRAAGRAFGEHPMPAVALQLLALRPRLVAFGLWQAEACAVGWRPRFIESALPASMVIAAPPVAGRDDAPMAIRGRIDRIDWHAGLRRWRLIDFKTSDRGDGPRETHLRAGQGPERWRDLQLPLYWHGMREQLEREEPGSTIELGYVTLPANTEATGWMAADFTPDELDEALGVAARIVGAIRAGSFPLGDRPPKHDPFAVLLQRPVFGRDDDDESDGGEP